jgi:hypothetical protein
LTASPKTSGRSQLADTPAIPVSARGFAMRQSALRPLIPAAVRRLPRKIAACCVLLTLSGAAAKAQVITTFATGLGTLGTPDANVAMIAGPSGTPANPTIIEAYPLPNPWAPPVVGTHWVTPFASGIDAINAPVGSYTYQLTFNLPAGVVNPSLSLSYYVDDFVTGMSLNGNAITGFGAAGSNTLGTAADNNALDFVPGTNTLDIATVNVVPSPPGPNNPTGLDLFGSASGVPEPGSLVLCGAAAAVAAWKLATSRRKGGAKANSSALTQRPSLHSLNSGVTALA